MKGWVKCVEIKGRKMKAWQGKENRERVVRTLENCWPHLTQLWCQADFLIVP